MKRLLMLFFVGMVALSIVGSSTAFSAEQSAPQANHSALANFEVVILVADYFDEAPEADPDIVANGLCAITPTEQGFAVRGFSVDPPADDLTHGDLVTATIEEALLNLGVDEGEIEIVPVPLTGRSDESVVDTISAALDAHTSADFIVLNMSFAFVPCEFWEAMEAFGGEFTAAKNAKNLNQFRGVLNRAVAFYGNQVFPVMSNKFQNSADLHPLQIVLDAHPNVFAVSSAGNFGLDFPFWPGAFQQVVSVSASNNPQNGQIFYAAQAWVKQGNNKDKPLLSIAGANNQQLRVSNYGEVMIPGEFAVTNDYVVIGTSFAAPRLSAVIAYYVAEVGGNYCKADGRLAIGHGDYTNLTLAEVEANLCPALADVLPDF